MMKNLIYTITVACAWMTTISVAVVGSSLSSRANAIEPTCAAIVTAETSGASIREAGQAIARCNANQPSSTQSSQGIAQSQMRTSDQKPSRMTSNPVKQSPPQPSYCPPVPNVDSSALFYYFEGVQGCRYGS